MRAKIISGNQSGFCAFADGFLRAVSYTHLGIYELYNGQKLLQSEKMDFQTHLYKLGEMEEMLDEIGFSAVKTYSSYQKQIASDNSCEMFLYECRA